MIERFHPERAEVLAALERECFSLPWSRDQIAAYLQQPAARAWGVLKDGHPVGYISICLVVDEMEIHNLAVRANYRRRGIGRLLLRHALDYGRGRGVTAIFLEVRSSNAPARALYRKEGFILAGRRPGYYRDTGEDALVLKKILVDADGMHI